MNRQPYFSLHFILLSLQQYIIVVNLLIVIDCWNNSSMFNLSILIPPEKFVLLEIIVQMNIIIKWNLNLYGRIWLNLTPYLHPFTLHYLIWIKSDTIIRIELIHPHHPDLCYYQFRYKQEGLELICQIIIGDPFCPTWYSLLLFNIIYTKKE
jgi:hypothetical protein